MYQNQNFLSYRFAKPIEAVTSNNTAIALLLESCVCPSLPKISVFVIVIIIVKLIEVAAVMVRLR